ncbi:MAG: MATE family efflux transporter [bacterium]
MKNIFDFKTNKYILKIALPAIAGLSTQMIVSLVDTAMVGRLGDAKHALAAMGLGVLATWAIVSFFSSLATGTHVLIARSYGAKDYKKCGVVLNTSLIFSFFVGVVVSSLFVGFSYYIANFFAADPKVGELAGNYLHYRFMGIPFFLLTVSYRGFFFGIGNTKIFMYSGIIANLLNIGFNYAFIYGNFGAPEMGLAGAGLGSTLATICDAIFYFSVSNFSGYKDKFTYFKNFYLDKSIVKEILKISLPVSFQNVFILIGFLSFIAITGLIGTAEQAASQLVVSSLFISIMPCFGFGIATQTLVGNALGSGKIILAKHYGFQTSKIATVYTVFVGIIFILFPRFILYLITSQTEIVEIAVPALQIVGFGQVFYAVGVVLANGLQSGGNSLFVMVTEVILNCFVFVPAAYFFGVYMGYGLIGAWATLPLYVIIFSTVIFIKFKYGRWKRY